MTAPERRLVVNADDLGRTRGINEGIFAAHRDGIVSSATLMVGFAAAADAARQLAAHPRLGVGLHVTLTGAAPTLPPERVPSLVGADGRFPAKPEGIADPDPGELRAEVGNQLEIFRRLTGREPTHLDSHHHSHRHPAVLDAVVELARRHALPVRSSSPEIAHRLRDEGLATTDVFVERFFSDGATLPTLLEILRGCGPGATEVMCHPGRVDAELAAGSSYVTEREREIEVLCDPQARRLVEELGLRPCTFPEACGS